MTEINHENILIQVRDALNRNSIKLWVEPYCVGGESNENECINLAQILCQQIRVKYEYCLIAINELQNTALDNLKSIDEFNQTGLATLKIRVPCKQSGTKLLNVKVKLIENAKDLQRIIAEKLEIRQEKIKIIASGKVLDMNKSLAEQGVKNNKQIMALVDDDDDSGSAEDPYARIKKIRSEAEILLKNKNSNFLNIENQSGELIHLPENERRAIIMSLLLYEKGRVQLKNEKFSDALILFLEADEELKTCESTLVQSVDNVALLNLDIVWCYLNLKSITQLPDADYRLKICEDNFKRSYGENFSRVKNVKGSSENEKTLIARLHLMQGVLLFHQNRREEAKAMMEVAEREIEELKVDETSVTMLVEMGYSRIEAINGLRSSFNSIDGAVSFILDRRQKISNARNQGKKEKNISTFLNTLGISVNPRSVLTLSEMGFSKELCAIALQKSNGDLSDAISLIQHNQEALKAELSTIIKPNQDLILKLMNLGFEKVNVENFLKINFNDFQKALDALLEMKNLEFPAQFMDQIEASSSSNGPATSLKATLEKAKQKSVEEKEAFDDLRNDLNHLLDNDDEYLTLTLEKEQMFLNQYKNALRN
ncbi:CLUMA_CG017156, isoform A [Clunio marinus]|uniref:CLUMA_CG017156, isoform A n=1 Tax=Clunio marinus TaxID=568069 RepID=A0A1J1IVB8_9DIPT|nr:CLUMA_CG017156, isoform A [Clunio marinus]